MKLEDLHQGDERFYTLLISLLLADLNGFGTVSMVKRGCLQRGDNDKCF